MCLLSTEIIHESELVAIAIVFHPKMLTPTQIDIISPENWRTDWVCTINCRLQNALCK